MQKTQLQTPFGATLEVYHQGGHITSWVPGAGARDRLFVAKGTEYAEGKAIRGGVPVCFPQFAAFGTGVKHGFARTADWALESVNDQQTEAVFTLKDNEQTRELWPNAFELRLIIALSEGNLTMTLDVKNTDSKPWDFSGALHTYFAVSDFTKASVSSFEGATYWDNGTDLSNKKVEQNNSLTFTGALDRVYFDAPDSLLLNDGANALEINKTGFTDVVVWNPGAEGAQGLKDMHDDEYTGMLCVEAAIVDKPITLAPGASWQGSQILIVKS